MITCHCPMQSAHQAPQSPSSNKWRPYFCRQFVTFHCITTAHLRSNRAHVGQAWLRKADLDSLAARTRESGTSSEVDCWDEAHFDHTKVRSFSLGCKARVHARANFSCRESRRLGSRHTYFDVNRPRDEAAIVPALDVEY